jgi:P4 family phage/plasmid primase-like protien
MTASLGRYVAFDLETYPDHWCVGFHGIDQDGHLTTWIVETRADLRKLLKRFADQERTLAGYNSERFDVPLIRAILKGIDPYSPAQEIIKSGSLPPSLKNLPAFPCDHVDLSARLRRGGAFPGLKTVAAYLGRPVLRELPFPPGTILTADQWQEVKAYNAVDLVHTWALLEQLAPELEALAALSRDQKQDLRSVSTPQVVERIFIAAYHKQHGCDPDRIQAPGSLRYRPVEGAVRPRTKAAAGWFDLVVNEPIAMVPRSGHTVPNVPTAKFSIGRLNVSVGAGGLHSVDSPRVYYATRRYRLLSVDVASYYPSLIATKGISPAGYGDSGRDTYRSLLERRLAVKKAVNAEADPKRKAALNVQADGLKLVLNSFVGKTGDPYSTLYDPGAFLAVTISGQLMLIDLIERLTRAKVRVISANTDGLFLKVSRTDEGWREILNQWQADTGMKLDVDPLRRLAILASNQYATRDVKDRVKRKGGELRGSLDWTHAPNHLVVNDAIVQALLFDVPTDKTIFSCRDLVRFCSVTKRSSKAAQMVLVDGDEVTELPRVTRWYRARDTSRRIETRFEGGRHSTPSGAQAVTVCQDLPARGLPDDIDWTWYLGQAQRKVQNVPGYRHLAKRHLKGNPIATRILEAGLTPVPKRGKAQPAGSDAKHPTLLWDYNRHSTGGVYTGPIVHTLVLDVDQADRFRKFVEKDNDPLFGDRWASLDGALVSVHGEATAEGVRTGRDRGKLIFRFDGGPDHPLCRMSKAKWLKTRGVEVFYGHGLPSVLGQYDDNGDRYRLEGTLSEAPAWLIEALTPRVRVRKPQPAAAVTAEEKAEAFERLPEDIARYDSRLGEPARCWRRKDLHDGRSILVGRCISPHTEANDAELAAGIGDDGPYLKCVHEGCVETQEINRRMRADYASKIPQASRNGAVHIHVEPVGPVNQEAIDPVLAAYPRTDTGNAERLVARFGPVLRFCHPWKKWMVFDDRGWKEDDTAAVNRMVKQTVRAMYREASYLNDPDDAKDHAKYKSLCETRDRRNAMRELAACELGIPVLPAGLDAHPWLFNCLNGTLDLEKGILRPHNRTDLITQLCPVEYHPDATCPLWDRTLELFLPDAGVREYFNRLCGLAMTGVIRDHLLPVLWGRGSNGKSTILLALQDVFGSDYAMKAAAELLMFQKNPGSTTERMTLFRKRLVVAIETEEGRRLNETMVKELTGGDPIRGRRMREDDWQFDPTHTVFLATNHKPVIRGTDWGLWRRTKLVPFTVTVPDRTADKTVPERLRGEREGILAWCVRGCLAWVEKGLQEPESVIQATQSYRDEQDILGAFLNEHTISNPKGKVQASALYERYKVWADASSEFKVSLTRMAQA